MKPSDITYDISRCYIQDRKSTIPEDCFNLIHGAIRARDYRYLAGCGDSLLPDVTGAEAWRTILQIEAFFKKNASFTAPLEARLSALLSFEEGERICERTNERLDLFFSEHGENHPDLRKKVKLAQRYIDKVLGDPADFVAKLPQLVRVTTGATATRSRRHALPPLKINKRVTCTPGALPYLDALSAFWGYGDLGGKLISRNRVTFVPKSWKTERTIACEPDGNLPLQLAFDSYAKTRLRRVGINLSDQTRNQELACEGSISDGLATIDLSMASDTLAYNTVALLLPESWFGYLRSVRSQYYEMYKGERKSYHKFSSMGNGATFALETLVFAALAYSVGSKRFSVYGDDIIVETELANDLIELLAFFGFTVNTEKSYTSGPFKESCGAHWYSGVRITPKYIRELDRRKATWCHLVNCMMAICKPGGQLEDYLVALVHKASLPLVPFNEDSMSGVWVDTHTAYVKKLIVCATRGRYAWRPRMKAYKPTSRAVRFFDSRALFLWFLETVGRDNRSPYESSRYAASGHKYVRKWVHWRPVVGSPENLNWFSDRITGH